MSAFLYVIITFLFIMNNGRLFALIHSLSTPRKPQPPRAEKNCKPSQRKFRLLLINFIYMMSSQPIKNPQTRNSCSGIFVIAFIQTEGTCRTGHPRRRGHQRREAQYTLEMSRYIEDVKAQDALASEQYALAVEKAKRVHHEKVKAAKKELDQSIEKKHATENAIENNDNSPVNTLQEEIDKVESLLTQFCETRHKMYSCGVLYEKYHDFVAVAMFYEYLASGRCNSLDGPDGAYNLYENESRANIIITQLSTIISSLEDIKQNQFAIYRVLTHINNEITHFNEQTEKMVSLLENIDQKADLIAYNTERTAYYAKKNAELTNALGFLITLQ